MPQNKPDFSSLPDKPGTVDFSTLPDQPKESESPLTWANAVRMGGSTAADIIGGLTGPGYYPISFAGGAASEGIARWMEGKPFDPTIMGIEGLANLVPGPNIPGKGAGIKEISKFALKSGGYGAAQGGIGAFPRHLADEGTLYDPSKWTAPSDEKIVQDALMGFGTGTAVGAGLGTGHVKYQDWKSKPSNVSPHLNGPDLDLNAPPPSSNIDPNLNTPEPYVTPPATIKLDPSLTQRMYDLGYSQGDINRMSHGDIMNTIRRRIRYKAGPDTAFSQAMRSRPQSNTEAPPVDIHGNEIEVPEPEPATVDSAFVRAMKNSTTNEDAPRVDVMGNELPEPEQFPELNQPAPPPQQPQAQASGTETKILDKPLSSYNMLELQSQGWQFAGMVDGKIQLSRKTPDLSISNESVPDAAAGTEGVAVNPDGDLQWPTRPSPEVVQNVEAQGFKFDSAANIFRKVKAAASEAIGRAGEAEGTFTPTEMWENLKRLLGRDPSDEELGRAVKNQVQPGETTGRVAQFEPKLPESKYFPGLGNVRPTKDGKYWIDESGKILGPTSQLPNGSAPQFPSNDMGVSPSNAGNKIVSLPLNEIENPSYSRVKSETGIDGINRIWVDGVEQTQFGPGGPTETDMRNIRNKIDHPELYAELERGRQNIMNMELPEPSGDIGAIRPQHVMDPRMAARVEAGGPREFDFTRPESFDELPLMGETPDSGTPIDADANARMVNEAMDRLRNPPPQQPNQMSMGDQMKDAEIADYLRNEDARPPEMTDLGDITPQEMRRPFPPEDNLFKGSEGQGLDKEKTFEQQWQESITEAETLGIDWRQYDNIDELQWDITRKAAIETMKTGKNPLDNLPQEMRVPGHREGQGGLENVASEPMPSLQDTISTPGADIKMHYDVPPGNEASEVSLHMTNKGMYQGTNRLGYGENTPNVPSSIVADIVAKVEEGHADYPFSANREQISDDVTSAIHKWVKDNIITGVTQKRVAAIQKMYDDIQPLHPGRHSGLDYLDEGNLLTPQELDAIRYNPKMLEGLQVLEAIQKRMLAVADNLGWTPENYGARWKKPSERLQKFGILFKGPDTRGTTLGIHVPRPDDLNNSAILINIMEHLNDAHGHATPIDQLATALITTLAHEQAHIPGGSHDKGHSYRDADLRSKFGADKTIQWLDLIGKAFGDGKGKLDPEISRVLQIYNGSRQRTSSGPNALLATGISSQRQPGAPIGEVGNTKGTGPSEDKPGLIKELWNLPTNATTTLDYSAPGRQGLSQILTKDFWTAAGKMFKGGLSPESFDKIDAETRALPIHQQKWDANTGKPIPTIASEMGIKMMEPGHRAGPREESVASNWIETGNFLGGQNVPFTKTRNPLAATWEHTIGRPIRGSNRAFTTFLNTLRSNRAQRLMDLARDMSQEALTTGSARPGIFRQKYTGMDAMALDPYFNKQLAREIGDFVNTATGRGPLKIKGPWKGAEISFEGSANTLAHILFSPRNLFSKIAMLNPSTYIMASPFVRKQYMKAALSSGMAWIAFSQLAKFADKDEVQVSNDPTNADFQKIRIGDTRIDPGSGFQQFLVLLARGAAGGYTSSVSEEFHKFGEGYNPETLRTTGQRFIENKLNPMTKFIYDLIDASDYKPFNVMDRTLQMAVPLMVQDLIGIVKENPELLPWMVPVIFGAGTQTYDKNDNPGRLVPSEYDRVITGGGPLDWMGLGDEQ